MILKIDEEFPYSRNKTEIVTLESIPAAIIEFIKSQNMHVQVFNCKNWSGTFFISFVLNAENAFKLILKMITSVNEI